MKMEIFITLNKHKTRQQREDTPPPHSTSGEKAPPVV